MTTSARLPPPVCRRGEAPVIDSLRVLSLLAATLATGLMAGLYFAFSCAVMPGLASADDRTFVAAMQWINVRILNGWFAVAFGGSFVLTTVALLLHVPPAGRGALPWVAAALVLNAATLVVTFRVKCAAQRRPGRGR